MGALEFQNEARRVRDRAEAVVDDERASTVPASLPAPRSVPHPAPWPDPQPLSEPETQEPPGDAVRRRLPLLREGIGQPDEVVDHSPAGAIVSAWNALQIFAEEILTRYPWVQPRRPVSGRVPPGELVRMLQRAGLHQEWVDVMDDLRRLRNAAVHGTAAVTPQAARDFIQGCKSAAIALEGLT
ncbi:hypothetical protein GCM10009549_52530 [Streptomyces thermoalcalitolerans]|uniref:DUF4145 domain-containing protein n=1 Tax=Streptomyces thermoalcalitolerans TaxID=65605 RepID=A0ABN1PLN6_9ACTN